ncbi:nitrilase-related carbon-nitrogen hydrolase [Pseudomonas sp. TWRC1-2]|uniref:nitrilase-related carbon-nitrogen hydrolase n=1 Tax=Pseudomonas sp. TWRC1-2 TaxID=2804628 RepID=UPI003CFB6889
MKVELAQIKGRDGDTAYNLTRALEVIATCAVDTDLLILPETYITGFPTKDNIANLAEPLNGPSIQRLHAAAKARNISVAVGFAEVCDGRYFNTTVLITPEDGVALHYRKTQLWSGERDVFEPEARPLGTASCSSRKSKKGKVTQFPEHEKKLCCPKDLSPLAAKRAYDSVGQNCRCMLRIAPE